MAPAPPPAPGGEVTDQGSEAVAGPTMDDRERTLDPRIVQVWRIGLALTLVVPLLVPAVVAPIALGRWGTIVTVAMLVLLAVWVLRWPPARYRRWRWRLGPLALELRHGVVVLRHQAVPYFRIQQIDVIEGPIDRLLGLATLQVTTASASGSAALPGLTAADAPAIRVELLARAAAAVGEHEGELRDAV
jgi:membrane protein YdbS with pleckstrin-like domain